MSQERSDLLKEWYCPFCGTKNQSIGDKKVTLSHTAFGLVSYCINKHPYEYDEFGIVALK